MYIAAVTLEGHHLVKALLYSINIAQMLTISDT